MSACPSAGGDTIQIIVVDTMSLIGGLNPVPTELPPLYYPPPGPAFHRKFRRNLAQGGKLEPEPQADADAGRDAASFMRSAAAKAAVRRQATSASGEARRRAMAAAEGGGGGGQGVRAAGEGGKVWRSLKRAGRRLSQMAAMGPAVAATGTGMAAATATTATPAYGAAATATPAYSTAATSAYGAAATGAATGAATPAYGGVGATMGAGGINPWAPGGVGMSGGGTGMGTGVGTGLPPYNAAGAAAYASATAAAAAAGTTGVASGAAPTPAEIAIASAKAAAALKATTYDFVPSPPWAPVINYPTSPPPPVDEAQWEWIGTTLNTSTADWIVVVGYHPVWCGYATQMAFQPCAYPSTHHRSFFPSVSWSASILTAAGVNPPLTHSPVRVSAHPLSARSAGSWGPTWPLVERLAPLLDSAGVALYLSGCDHLMQHFKPVPSWTNVDYVVVGAGAFSNANVTSATAMPHADDCPDDSLQFSYEATPGFVNVQIASANVKEPSTLHVNFFDSNQTMMYTFYKENPRTEAGHRDGDLASPPAPGFGGHDDDFNSEPLIIMGGAFLVVAVALCLFGAASHARRQLSYMSVIKGKGAGNTGKVVGVEESTPLIRGGTGRLATRAGAIGFVNSARGGGAAGGVTQRL